MITLQNINIHFCNLSLKSLFSKFSFKVLFKEISDNISSSWILLSRLTFFKLSKIFSFSFNFSTNNSFSFSREPNFVLLSILSLIFCISCCTFCSTWFLFCCCNCNVVNWFWSSLICFSFDWISSTNLSFKRFSIASFLFFGVCGMSVVLSLVGVCCVLVSLFFSSIFEFSSTTTVLLSQFSCISFFSDLFSVVSFHSFLSQICWLWISLLIFSFCTFWAKENPVPIVNKMETRLIT